MKVIRRASLIPVPWKNGGGITHEVIRSPDPGRRPGDAFDWRVSIAHIEASGPFSDFAGYWRFMVLLEGAGLDLEFDGEPPESLHQIGDMANFNGGLPTRCELLKGRCTDLNLMVSMTVPVLHAGVERLRVRRPITSDSRVTELICVVAGEVDVDPPGGVAARLGAGDVALITPPDRAGSSAVPRAPIRRAVLRPAATDGAPSTALVFLASLDDNRAA